MQLQQQESFEIHGPQLEVLGNLETALPAPVRKRPAGVLAVAVLALVSVVGIGGLQLRGLWSDTAAIYTAQQDDYGHSIQGDFATQVDAAASMIRVATGILGSDDSSVQFAQQALDAWNANSAADANTQYALNQTLYGAIDLLYTTAADQAGSTAKGQLDDLYASFVSAQTTIERAAAAYNVEAEEYLQTVSAFPASLLAGLWGVGDIPTFAPAT